MDIKVVGTFPLTFAVRAPEGFKYKAVGVANDVTCKTQKDGNLLRVTLTTKETKDVKAVIKFE